MTERSFTAVVTVVIDDDSEDGVNLKEIEDGLLNQVILELGENSPENFAINIVSIDWSTLKENSWRG